MKVIPKLQGGGFMSLFTQYVPVQSPAPSQQARSSSSSSKEEAVSSKKEDSTKGKLTEKDLFDLVSKVDGLPNDTKKLVTNLSNMFQLQQLTGVSDIADLANVYLSNLYSIKIASFNKKEYDSALAEVTKNGGLNEYAITTSGDIIVMDEEDNLKQISVSELLKGSGKYRPLTNSNLLYLRAYQPEYANKNEILNTVRNGIGIQEVDKMIREKLSSLGTSETVRSGYSVKADSYIAQGMEVLSKAESAAIAGQTGMTLDGMYKNKIITKDQKEQASAALQYIYNTLPSNAKTLLSIKGIEARISTKQEDAAKGIIFSLITSRMSQTNSQETDWVGTLEQVTKSPGSGSSSGSGSGSGDGSGSDDIKTDPYYNMTRSWGGEDGSVTIKTISGAQLNVDGTVYSSIPDKEGTPIGRTSLAQALSSGLQGIITDPSAITFGNVNLTTNDFQNIVFDGLKGGILVPLPYKLSANGTKMANLDVMDQWENALEKFRKLGIDILSPESVKKHAKEVTQILYSNNLEGLVDINGEGIDYSKLGQFLVVDGYAVARDGDNRFNSKSVDYLSSVDDYTKKTIIESLSTNDKKNNYELDLGGFSWNNDNIYKGSIYIPITNNQLKGLTASGQHVKEGPAMEKEYEYQMFNKMMTAKKPPQLGII